MTSAHHDTPYSWARLAVSLAIACVGNVGMWAVIVVLPSLQAEFAVERADAALPYTLNMVGFALGNLLIGRAVDRYGITLSLTAASLVVSLGFALSAVMSSIAVVAALHVLIGFGTSASFAPLIADISHWFMRRRGIAVAVVASGNYLSGAIWPVLLIDIQESEGWRAVYFILAVAVPAAVIPMSLFLRRQVSAEASAISDQAAAARRRNVPFSSNALLALLAVAGVGCCVAMSMPQVHIVAYSVDLGFGAQAGAQMLSLMLMGGVVSRLVSGFVADRLGGVKTLLIGSSLQCLALFAFLPSSGLAALYAVALAFGLAQGGIIPSYAIIVREYLPGKDAGARVGLVIFATIIGMAFGGWVSGWIYDMTGSYRMAFLNGIGWNLLNIAIAGAILLLSRPGRTARA